jgi:soluble lytic murein transglycosylase
MIFPVVHYDLIKQNAAANQLDPILVLSLMKQESAFEADVASSVGASGLMQLMPATASETEPGIRRADLVIPEHNVRVGTKYLRKLLDKYNGNIAFALAAYNAGPGNLDKWIREGKTRHGLLEFIEQIPFKETREYVSSIIRNHYWYSKTLSTDPPKSLGYFWNLYGPPELAPSTVPSVTPSP